MAAVELDFDFLGETFKCGGNSNSLSAWEQKRLSSSGSFQNGDKIPNCTENKMMGHNDAARLWFGFLISFYAYSTGEKSKF